jgi:Zn finger protein HypA/HybF involved in hydrogenase expression
MTQEQQRIDSRFHISGKARCLACKHEWAAVSLVGTVWLECPACSLEHAAITEGKTRRVT